MGKHSRGVALLTVSAFTLSACVTGQQLAESLEKTAPGLGGLAAVLFCKDQQNALAQVACAVTVATVVSAIGSEIAKKLKEEDQRRLYAAQQEAFLTGRPTSFQNPETGVSATVTVVRDAPPQVTTTKVQVLKDQVEVTPPLEAMKANFRVKQTARLRAGPGTDYRIVDTLPTGRIIEVIGKVQGKEWYLASVNGIGSGYVFASLVEPAPTAVAAPAPAPAPAAPPPAVAEVPVQVAQSCKVTLISITTKDGPTSQEVTVCQQPDGSLIPPNTQV